MKWVSVATVQDQITAEMWCELLEREGVPAFAKMPSSGGYANLLFGTFSPYSCWVMVQEDRREEAAVILRDVTMGEAATEP